MIINIYEPRDKWILQNIIDAIKKFAPEDVTIRSIYYKDRIVYPDGINFFCNMGIYAVYLRKTHAKPSRRDVVRTTHIERWNPWNYFYKRPYYYPITQIAHSTMWLNWFKEHNIHPVGVAIPGVDNAFFNIQRTFDPLKKKTIAIIGRLYRSGRKGEEWLKPLLEKVGHDFDWLIIGNRWGRVLKKSLIKKYNITYRKNYKQEEYYAAFHDFDIFLSLSKVEGGPMPLLESMAAGILPVVSDTGFARDLIKDEKNGFIYEIGNIEQCAKILLSLKNKDLNEDTETVKISASPHTWQNFVSKIISLLRDIDSDIAKK